MKYIRIPSEGTPFRNNATYCVGTGRMGLALQQEYQEQLQLVQETIRFQYIRGHGLFCDDVGIYREVEVDGVMKTFFNFTYLDRIMDSYLAKGIRPFLELGFMPEKLKTGEQTVFYWKGNVTPPASYEKWAELVKTTLSHLVARYGREEVVTWPVEVWNEPNIPFWAGTMEEYFHLYDVSAQAVKAVDPRIGVGGPAICGVETEKWLRGFFEHVEQTGVPCDFITRHCYTADETTRSGEFIYHTLHEPTRMIDELKETRAYMADYASIRNLPLHITEFNSSYVPLCPLHDTDFHAPYIARILSEAGEYADSYSYWTFGDVFEEADVPKATFHGGFGLVALDSIKKPTFHAFDFFSKAGDELLYRDENLVVTRKGDRLVVIAWNGQRVRRGETGETLSFTLSLPATSERAMLVRKEVGGDASNPLRTWCNMGRPRTLNAEQKAILRNAGEARQTDDALIAAAGRFEVSIELPAYRLTMLEIMPVEDLTDTYLGFDPDKWGTGTVMVP